MKKNYKKKMSAGYSMYCVSPNVVVSANSQMRIADLEVDTEYLDAYDEERGRWFCELGCGFRYHGDAYDVLDESITIINRYLARRNPDDIVRKSQAIAWTYDYERGVFCCDYELTEYDSERSRSAQFSVGSVRMENLEEIEKAIRKWHCTGEMVLDVLTINFGNWTEDETWKRRNYGAQTESVGYPAENAGIENDDKLPF